MCIKQKKNIISIYNITDVFVASILNDKNESFHDIGMCPMDVTKKYYSRDALFLSLKF